MSADDRRGRADRLQVEEVIRVVTEGLGSWMSPRIGTWPPGSLGKPSPHDLSYLIKVLLELRRSVFAGELQPSMLAESDWVSRVLVGLVSHAAVG